jgi:hypothetical protein
MEQRGMTPRMSCFVESSTYWQLVAEQSEQVQRKELNVRAGPLATGKLNLLEDLTRRGEGARAGQ